MKDLTQLLDSTKQTFNSAYVLADELAHSNSTSELISNLSCLASNKHDITSVLEEIELPVYEVIEYV